MDIWTDGTLAVTLNKYGLRVHEDGESRTILGPKRVTWVKRSNWRNVLTVDAQHRRVWLVDEPGNGRMVDLEGGAIVDFDAPVVDLVVRDDGGFVAAIKDDRQVVLAEGKWEEDTFSWTGAFSRPGGAEQVEWPSLLWDDGAAPFNKQAAWSSRVGALRLNLSPFGLAVADADSGLVAVKRDPTSGGFDFACRLPATDDSQMQASATPQGFVAVVVAAGGETALVHVNEQADVIGGVDQLDDEKLFEGGHVQAFGENAVAFFGHEKTAELSLPQLEPTGLREDRLGRAARLVVAGRGGSIDELAPQGLVEQIHAGVDEPREEPTKQQQSDDEEVSSPVLQAPPIQGEPRLELKGPDPGSLELEVGEPFELQLQLLNRGGRCEEVTLGFEGGAAARRFLRFEQVQVGTATGEPTARGALVEDVEIEAAREAFDSTPIPVESTLVLRGEAARAGTGKLMIRISPVGEISTEAAAGRYSLGVTVG